VLDCHEQGNGHKICVLEDSGLVVCYVVSISKQLLMLQSNIEALIVIITLYQSRHSQKRVLGLLHPEYEGKMIL
jgi:hypothetical protein